MVSLFNEVQKNIHDKNDIREDLKIINAKILNKNWNELKIEKIQNNLEKLEHCNQRFDELISNY